MKLWPSLRAILPAALLALSALHAAPVQAESVIETIQKRGTLKVGLSTFVPWAMRDKDGALIGYEIDVAKKVAADMGVEVEFIPTDWAGIIPALLAEKFDVIIGGMSITPERNLTVNFTEPYAHSGVQLLANKALAGSFTTLEQFNDPAVTIACRRGATPCAMSETLFPKATLLQFDDDNQAVQEVLNGNAHAAPLSAPKPAFSAEENPDKLFVALDGKNLIQGDEAFALRKGDPDALNFFSNWIVVNTSNGFLAERQAYWFGGQAAWKDTVAAEQ